MSSKKRTSTALALLIPTGVIGISSALAVNSAHASGSEATAGSVADRLAEIRQAVSTTIHDKAANKTITTPGGANLMLAEWLNVGGFGWHNGGWGNGGWHNWGNGGWGNGGWHNWGNGGWHNWGNGWHNFWHNW